MACRPTVPTHSRPIAEPFSFDPSAGMMQGFTMMATLWSAPWRAAMILAQEAMREGSGRHR